jgi:hypothetical protein
VASERLASVSDWNRLARADDGLGWPPVTSLRLNLKHQRRCLALSSWSPEERAMKTFELATTITAIVRSVHMRTPRGLCGRGARCVRAGN